MEGAAPLGSHLLQLVRRLSDRLGGGVLDLLAKAQHRNALLVALGPERLGLLGERPLDLSESLLLTTASSRPTWLSISPVVRSRSCAHAVSRSSTRFWTCTSRIEYSAAARRSRSANSARHSSPSRRDSSCEHARELGAGRRERTLELRRPLLVFGFEQGVELGSLGVELILGRAAAHAAHPTDSHSQQDERDGEGDRGRRESPQSLLRAAQKQLRGDRQPFAVVELERAGDRSRAPSHHPHRRRENALGEAEQRGEYGGGHEPRA